jgi:molybdate transport system regulatory protein
MATRKKLPYAELLGFEASDKRIDILRRIAAAGSISEAARGAGVSYKAAWQALETLGNLAGTALVSKEVGGPGGGGAELTATGQRVLQAAEALARVRTLVLSQLDAYAGDSPARAALALRTSLRNQFPCVVRRVRRVQGMLRVELALGDGTALHARITRESGELLDLHPGQAVLGLFKATAVQVAPRLRPASGRNLLQGVVSRASRAAQGGEASLRLPGGIHIVGFAQAGGLLRAGQDAMASVDESAVVIAAQQ